MSEDEKKLKQIFNQGKRVAELRRTESAMKFASGGITVGPGIAPASGPVAPLTLAVLAVTGAGLGLGKFTYDRKKKKNLQKT